MHRAEEGELSSCADCGAEVWISRDRGYRFGQDLGLCFDCSVRRGGVWDEGHDRWLKDPDLAGLDEVIEPRLSPP